MTAASRQPPGAVEVQSVDFAVPGRGTIGPRFASWQEAVDHAREGITRVKYRGQQVNEDSADFHPRRHFQEGGTLVVCTRAFVHMRTVTAERSAGGLVAGQPAGGDSVVCTWEVFQDGTVEEVPERREHGPEVRAEDQAAARQLESAGYQILDQGWQGTGGRLDLVAAQGTTLIVCQVRPRTTGAVLSPPDRARLRRLANVWLTAYGVPRFDEIRVDLALYYTDAEGFGAGWTAIEHIPGVG
jgi:putative endonuclease